MFLFSAWADWPWSSFRHYLTGEIGAVEIESEWTWRRRRSMGIELKMKVREKPPPNQQKVGRGTRVSLSQAPAGPERDDRSTDSISLRIGNGSGRR